GHFPDDDVARFCRLSDDEWPMLIVKLNGASIPAAASAGDPATWLGGTPNKLSDVPIAYPPIDAIHSATKYITFRNIPRSEPAFSGSGDILLPAPSPSTRPFGELARTRRSALDFTGESQ